MMGKEKIKKIKNKKAEKERDETIQRDKTKEYSKR